MNAVLYRYVSDAERQHIEQSKMIRSHSGKTYFSPDLYDAAADARQRLALSVAPAWRVGPIPADEMPDFDAVSLQAASPKYGQPGGGLECATRHIVYLFGFSRLK